MKEFIRESIREGIVTESLDLNLFKVAKRFVPETVYHGTLAKNLRGILSSGISSKKVGTGWGSDVKGQLHVRDMSAIGGVYFTKDIGIALDAAGWGASAANDDGLIIQCSIQPRTMILDEDLIESEFMAGIWSFFDIAVGKKIVSKSEYASLYYLTNPVGLVSYIHEQLPRNIKDVLRKNAAPDFITQFVMAALRRLLPYLSVFAVGKAVEEVAKSTKLTAGDVHAIYRRELRSATTVEKDMRLLLDKLTRSATDAVYTKDPYREVNFRRDESIGFKGINKITAIVGVKVVNEVRHQYDLTSTFDVTDVYYGSPSKGILDHIKNYHRK